MNYEAFQSGRNRQLLVVLFPLIFGRWFLPHWVASSRAFLDQYSVEYLRGCSVSICCSDSVQLFCLQSSVLQTLVVLVPKVSSIFSQGVHWTPVPEFSLHAWRPENSRDSKLLYGLLYRGNCLFPTLGNHYFFCCCCCCLISSAFKTVVGHILFVVFGCSRQQGKSGLYYCILASCELSLSLRYLTPHLTFHLQNIYRDLEYRNQAEFIFVTSDN